MSLKRKYVDSHWLVFAFQGAISLLFGWFTLFANVESVTTLITIIGVTLLGLGIIELFNMLRRTHLRETWGISLGMAVFEIAVAFALLFTLDMGTVYHLAIIAAYTVVRGLMEIIMGIKSVDDRTDRFIWAIIGICGCIMGFVILNSGSFVESISFVKTFGAYMMLSGLANLIYGVHNRDQAKELAESRRTAAKRSNVARRSAKVNNAVKTSSPKSVKSSKVARTTKSTRTAKSNTKKGGKRASTQSRSSRR